MIYHITTRTEWKDARKTGSYRADSLESQGFIHCSKLEQVVNTADHYFRGREGLVLLCIDEKRLRAEVRYENLEGGKELFPHIYGVLNLEAVTGAVNLKPLPSGEFVLPEGLGTA